MSKISKQPNNEDLQDLEGLEKINEQPIDDKQFYRGDKKLLKDGAQFEWTPKMVKETQKCKDDIIYFSENHFYITNVDKGKMIIPLYVAQKQILRSLQNNRFVALLSCRQAGKTTLTTIFALWLTCFTDDQRVVIVANNENTAIRVLKRIRLAYEMLPAFLKPGLKEYGKTGITFANDSSIGVSTTTSTAARGDTANCLIIDEAAFIEQSFLKEFWKSVIPVISSGKKTKIFMVSTPNGTDNKFYEIYSGAATETNGWKAERIDWWDVPGRTEKWKKQIIAALGSEEAFDQEFGNHFANNGESAISTETIERFKRERKQPLWTSQDNTYRVYDAPEPGKLYVVGVDVGEGINRASSVAQVLDVTDLKAIEQVAVYATSTVDPYHFANKLYTLCRSWGSPPVLIERNNCGAQVIDALFHTLNYERIVNFNKLSNSGSYANTRNLGIYSHNNLRSDAISSMRYWINSLHAVKMNDLKTIQEFETFVKQPNQIYRKRNDSVNDDHVMALVWALQMLNPELCPQWFNVQEHDTQGMPSIITDNGYFDLKPEDFIIKDIDTSTIISIIKPIIDIKYNSKDLYEEKYDEDIDTLISQGYTYL
jgi:hypothetical protein